MQGEAPPAELLDISASQDEHFIRLRDFVARRTPEAVLQLAASWMESGDDTARAVALDCLAVMPASTPGLSVSFSQMAGTVSADSARDVRWALAHALLLQPSVDGLNALLYLARDPDRDVRWLVAQALPTGDAPAAAVSALVVLSDDGEGDIRDWALHGLAALAEPTDAVIAKLRAHVDDVHPEAAAEAVLGLARAKDPSAAALLRQRLLWSDVGELYVEAAEESGDPRLLEPLLRLRRSGWADDESTKLTLQRALGACGLPESD